MRLRNPKKNLALRRNEGFGSKSGADLPNCTNQIVPINLVPMVKDYEACMGMSVMIALIKQYKPSDNVWRVTLKLLYHILWGNNMNNTPV